MPGKSLVAVVACAVLMGAPAAVPFASAQTRVNDRDMQVMIRNLRADSKSFQSAFKDSIRKSTIRGTSQEKKDREMVATFVKQTEAMSREFKKSKHVDTTLPAALDTADRINSVVTAVQLDSTTQSRWEKVRVELGRLADAAGVTNPLAQSSLNQSPNAKPPAPIGSPAIRSWVAAAPQPVHG